MSILVINAGSSSLKFGLFDAEANQPLASGMVDWGGSQERANLTVDAGGSVPIRKQVNVSDHHAAVGQALEALQEGEKQSPEGITVVGHRIVHGGSRFREGVCIDAAVQAGIAALAELAPLHNPPALAGIEASAAALPGIPQVAVFDTAFFSRLAPSDYIYPLPYAWYADWGVRRYGFHGISHAYCAARAAEMLGRPAADLRLVICHLGNGCSASAVRTGAAVTTTMGFTPLERLMMGSRSGSIDPSILLYVQRRHGLTVDQLDQALNHESGLRGVSGISSDYRLVAEAARQGHDRACLALRMYADRVRAAVGALAVTLGGIEALVFTAGVGEHAADLRASVCAGLECLGLRLDPSRNQTCEPDGDIAADDSCGRILVLHTREEMMIAREARRLGLAAG